MMPEKVVLQFLAVKAKFLMGLEDAVLLVLLEEVMVLSIHMCACVNV